MRKGFIYLNSKGHVSRERGDERIPAEEPWIINQAVHMLDEFTWSDVLSKSMIKSDFVKEMFSINRPVLQEDPKVVSFYKYKNFA